MTDRLTQDAAFGGGAPEVAKRHEKAMRCVFEDHNVGAAVLILIHRDGSVESVDGNFNPKIHALIADIMQRIAEDYRRYYPP